MKRVTDDNINTHGYWDSVYESEPIHVFRVDPPRLRALDRWIRVREEEVQRAARIYDYGCGRGDALIHLWRERPDRTLVGVDISSVAIQHARARIAAEAPRFPGTDHTSDKRITVFDQGVDVLVPFDIVWCGETIEHVENPDGLIRQLAFACAHDGFVVLSTPFKGRNRSPEHVHEFSPDDITRWAAEIGELVFLDCLLLPSWLTMFAVFRKGKHT